MGKTKVVINQSNFNREVSKKARKQILAATRKEAVKTVELAQKELLEEFNNHPVTRELDSGDGFLFSFIGFEEGSRPTESIRELLQRKISLSRAKVSSKNLDVVYSFNYVDEEDIFNPDVTPMPWASGISWARGIEFGISGLGRFLRGDFKGSRSGGGIQAEENVRTATYKKQSYIRRLISNFKRKIGTK